jgi:hypothetical protein
LSDLPFASLVLQLAMIRASSLHLFLGGVTLTATLCSSYVFPPQLPTLRWNPRVMKTILKAQNNGDASGGDEPTFHPQQEAPFVDALKLEASRVQAPFFFPGHSMGSGLSPNDSMYPLGSDARALLRVSAMNEDSGLHSYTVLFSFPLLASYSVPKNTSCCFSAPSVSASYVPFLRC